MLPQKYRGKNQRHSFHIKTEHVKTILKEAENCRGFNQEIKGYWKLFLYILTFTGVRQSEARAIHIADFPGSKTLDFTSLRIRRAKSGNIDEVYIIKPLQKQIRNYILNNKEWLEKRGGWLFPAGVKEKYRDRPFVSGGAANAMFDKLRKRAAKYDPDFLKRYEDTPNRFYKIRLHSLRHWHGTHIQQTTKDPAFVQKMLGHVNIETTYKYYVDYEAVAERMPEIYEENFAPFAKHIGTMKPEQQVLSEYGVCGGTRR